MTKATSVRLDQDLIDFIHNELGATNTTDGIRGVLLWAKQYKSHYLESIREHIKCMTNDSGGLSEKS